MVAIDNRRSLSQLSTPRVARPRRTSTRSWTAQESKSLYAQGDLPTVIAGAIEGNSEAWNTLMQLFGGMIVAVARSCRLNDADVGEVHQVTWLRLVENIGRIEHPERVGAWLATTARRESLRILRAKARVTFDHEGLTAHPDTEAKPLDAGPLADERSEALRRAFSRLPPHCKELLGILAQDEPPSYKEISKALSMPIGSIGPTRGRCLEHLRRILEEQGADV